jgi:large subunit ribosomal protein L29
MKTVEIRGLSDAELENKINEVRKAGFQLRLRAVYGQVKNTAEARKLRKELAQYLTIQRERELGIERQSASRKIKR